MNELQALLTELVGRHAGGAAGSLSWETYRRARRLGLSKYVLERKTVYLDTNHWVSLRDAASGRSRSASDAAALARLRELSGGHEIVIPASDNLVEEVLFQSDSETRLRTAELIDELTRGIALVGFVHRAGYEADSWITRTVGLDPEVEPNEIVWTWTLFSLGEVRLTASDQEEAQMDVVRRPSRTWHPDSP